MKVSNSINIKECINYGFKHPDVVLDYEKAVFNQLKERQLKDVSTDVFIKEMFSDNRDVNDTQNLLRKEKRFYFLAYVYTYLRMKLQIELHEALAKHSIILGLNERVMLLFKGGNMMFYKYEKLSKELNGALHDIFTKKFNEHFKVSDFDFTVYILVQDRKTFYKVKRIATQILWEGLTEVRDFFEQYVQIVLNKNLDVSEITNELVINPSLNDPKSINDLMQKVMKVEDDQNIEGMSMATLRKAYIRLARFLKKRLVWHKEPELLSEAFNMKYDKNLKAALDSVRYTWTNDIKPYIDKLRKDKKTLDIINNNDICIPRLSVVYEYLCLLTRFINVIDPLEAFVVNAYKEDVKGFLTTTTQEFTKQIQTKIIQCGFYSKDALGQLKQGIIKEFTKKIEDASANGKTFKVCKTIGDEYLSFDGDVDELKDESNFNLIELLPSMQLQVYESPRHDFIINTDLISDNEMYIDDSQSSLHYVYYNSTISKVRNEHSSVVDFDLLRIKYNLTLGGVEVSPVEEKRLQIPSEFVDISVCGYDDSALTQFRNHLHESLDLYQIEQEDSTNVQLRLECLGYSTKAMIHDLTYVLYEQNLFTPWTDQKYKKRIYRLSCLEMLSTVHDPYKFFNYFLSLYLVYQIIYNSNDYAVLDTIDEDNKIHKLYESMSENIFYNYERYEFKQVTHALPTMLMEVVLSSFPDNTVLQQKHSVPYPDQIIGSIVFYSLMSRKLQQDPSSLRMIHIIMNRYRRDFFFLPASFEDIKAIMAESQEYLREIADIYLEMLTLVRLYEKTSTSIEVNSNDDGDDGDGDDDGRTKQTGGDKHTSKVSLRKLVKKKMLKRSFF